MAREQLFVGLEIGTTKICVIVSEGLPDGSIHILGVGETPSRGIRKGEIVDFASVTECVREAIIDAEEKSNVEIRSVWVALSGSHLQSFNNRGTFILPEDRNLIEDDDLRMVEMSAKEVTLPATNTFLHTIIQSYHVDGNQNVISPEGMIGSRLEADFHIVHGVKTRIQNTLRCLEKLKLDVEDVVMSSLASAQVVLTQHQKDLGALVIDMGGGTTDFLLYLDGAVRHSGVLALGGDHITNDLSIGLRLPIVRAELLKIEEGSVLSPERSLGGKINLKNDPGFLGADIDRVMLDTIMNARVHEMLEILRREVERYCPLELLGAGVMLTGGSARLRGIKILAEEVFKLPVQITAPRNVSGPTSTFENPQFSTAIGLTKYANAVYSQIPEETFFSKISNTFGRLLRRR
ncbi:MAG: cell division protein FtsA [Verrucomicrobia bacterium RIFCSPHIGHO2_12_FULL_41_10]|nr:MAG: cell division protein FtsA [Verrucomicrobia bacterium RIFCSPHIGHO2_12_FULL_41_10]